MSTSTVRTHQITEHYSEGDFDNPLRRESFVLVTERGAVEGWRTPSPDGSSPVFPSGYFGGIEVHSKTPLYSGHEPLPGHCQWTGGTCHTDGSSLAEE